MIRPTSRRGWPTDLLTLAAACDDVPLTAYHMWLSEPWFWVTGGYLGSGVTTQSSDSGADMSSTVSSSVI